MHAIIFTNLKLRIFCIRFQWLLYLFGYLLISSCVSIRYQRDISEYQDEIQRLKAQIKANANQAKAWRDLGVIYFETANYTQAGKYLGKAYELDASDARTLFYLGMTLEFLNELPEALAIQRKYTQVSRLSPYRRLMAGRYHRIRRLLIRQELRNLLAREAQLSEKRMSTQTLAVFPLNYQGKDKRFAPLGRGLSEMIIIDLGQVQQLRLLERIRLQTLIDELKLAQTELIDPQSAPRLGKLLGAGRIIAGSFDVTKKKDLKVDVLSWDIINRQFPEATTQSDALTNLFLLEKDLVFGIIEQLGIELTPEEREKIQFFPTKNLQAFLAYCRGLEEEDAGDFINALQFYQKAKALDPEFDLAQQKAEAVQSLNEAGGDKQQILEEIARVEGEETLPEIGAEELVDMRLDNLHNNLNSIFVPGQDARKTVEEAATSGANLGELPPPPENPK